MNKIRPIAICQVDNSIIERIAAGVISKKRSTQKVPKVYFKWPFQLIGLLFILALVSNNANAEFLGNNFVVSPQTTTVVVRWGCVTLSNCTTTPGSFSVTTAPKHGVLSFGTATATMDNTILGCAGKPIQRAVAYYTWTDNQSNTEQDAFALNYNASNGCAVANSIQVQKAASPKNQGKADPDCPKTCDGNPINAATGNKFQVETDFVGAPNVGLEMLRFYNSQNNAETTFGSGWRSTWQQSVSTVTGSNTTQITRADGKIDNFTKNGDGKWQSDPDVTNQLVTIIDVNNQQTGWQLVTRDDDVEVYTLDGRLSSITNRAGQKITLSYDNIKRLNTVKGHFGYELNFSYDANNHVSSVTLPDGSIYSYGYDANNNLVSVTNPDKTVRRYVYENAKFIHALTGIIDENGKRFATYSYDTLGRATSSQHAGGAELTTVAYNTDSTATVTDALGNQHGYNFTTQFDVVKPTSVTGTASKGLGAKAFTYDANGFVASQTDFNGTVTTFVRDAGGLETSRTEAFGTALARTITTAWHSRFRLPIKITAPNRIITLTYDNSGNLTKQTVTAGADSRTSTFSYNSVGQVLTVDGARTDVNDVSQYAYDKQGNLITVTDALGHVTQVTAYNANGQPVSIKDANGLVKTLAYDARGRVTSTQIGTEVTAYAYDAVGQITKTTAANGSTITLNYDDAHRLVKVTDQLGNHLNYSLDAMDNRIKEEVYDPKSNLTHSLTSQFDSLNRLAAKIGAEGQTSSYRYDDNDNPVSLTDPLNNKTALSYDALNRLVSSVDPLGKVTKSTYDSNDNLLSVTDPLTHKTGYGYDGLGNALTINSPDTGVTTRSVDDAGNKIETVDARGEKTSYKYDALNRISTIKSGNNQTISFAYDQGTNGIGHLTQMSDPNGTTRWTYDNHGRINSKTFVVGTLSLVTRYGYDADGQLKTMTYPSGNIVQATYQNGLVTALDSNGKSLISSVTYQPFGAPAEWIFANGIKTTRDFDLDGRMTAYDLGDRSRQLSYDVAGRITGYQDTDMNHNQNFTYDVLSRLVNFSTPSSQIDYQYDANSNRTNKTSGTISDDLTLDSASNRLLGITENNNPIKTYQYDAAGNIISDGSYQFTYDGRGRLLNATGSFGTEQYHINGLGQRVAKVKGNAVDLAGDANQDGTLTTTDLRLIVLMTQGAAPVNLAGDCNHDSKITTADALCTQSKIGDMHLNPGKYVQAGTYFAYDEAGHLMGEYTQKGTAIQETVWLGDMPVAVMSGGNNYYVYADHLNTPKAIADNSGKVVWRWDSEAFGSTLANEDPDKDGKTFTYNLRFPGQYYDQSTGLHYNGFRDYDPKTGRYIESDPIGLAGGVNTFGYVGGNPVGSVDGEGLVGYTLNFFDKILDKVLYDSIERMRLYVKDGEMLIGGHAGSTGQIAINPGNDGGPWVKIDNKAIMSIMNYVDPNKTLKLVRLNACNSAKDSTHSLSLAKNLQALDNYRSYLGANGYYYPDGMVADMYRKKDNTPVNFENISQSDENNSYRIPVERPYKLFLGKDALIGGPGGLKS